MGKNEREFRIDQVIKIVACDGMPKRHVAMLNDAVVGQIESIQHEINEIVGKIQSQSMPTLEPYTQGAPEARYARYARVAKQFGDHEVVVCQDIPAKGGLSDEMEEKLLRLFFEDNVTPRFEPSGLRVTLHASDPKNEVSQRIASRVDRVARAVENGAHEISIERLYAAKDYCGDSVSWPLKLDDEAVAEVRLDGRTLRALRGEELVSAVVSQVQGSITAEREHRERNARPTITESRLAWSVFCSDPEVLAFVRVVGEVPPAEPAYDYASVAQQREDRALRIAWARNEKGWAHRARLRAHQMLRTLPGVETNREPGK
jgi:hypothetical protein